MKPYLYASDFDQTLSFNDSGLVLSQLIGANNFEEKVHGMSQNNLVQQGGELTYLLLHDPEFRRVRKEHLYETGKRIRLKQNIELLPSILANGFDGYQFIFYVISAAPEEVIHSALEGIVPPENIFGTKLRYSETTGEIESIVRVPAGYGKVAVLENLQKELQISSDRIIYVGDGSSDIHVMLHVNHHEGFTVAVSENKYIAPIAQRSILSEDALSPLIPVMQDIVGMRSNAEIRKVFASFGLQINEWETVQTDRLSITSLVKQEAFHG